MFGLGDDDDDDDDVKNSNIHLENLKKGFICNVWYMKRFYGKQFILHVKKIWTL